MDFLSKPLAGLDPTDLVLDRVVHQLIVNVHQVLEVTHGLDLELQGGVFVADKDGVGVLLEGGDGPHVTHPLLDGLVEGQGLVGPRDQNHHLQDKAEQSNDNVK